MWFGSVSVEMGTNKRTGAAAPFAFVTFARADGASDAVSELDGSSTAFSTQLKVELSHQTASAARTRERNTVCASGVVSL